jgi:hypothetical protein
MKKHAKRTRVRGPHQDAPQKVDTRGRPSGPPGSSGCVGDRGSGLPGPSVRLAGPGGEVVLNAEQWGRLCLLTRFCGRRLRGRRKVNEKYARGLSRDLVDAVRRAAEWGPPRFPFTYPGMAELVLDVAALAGRGGSRSDADAGYPSAGGRPR